MTPIMSEVLNDLAREDNESRRCSTPGNPINGIDSSRWPTELINICTDCFFLLQQIRRKARQRHIPSAMTSTIVSSTSSSSSLMNRTRHATINRHLSTSSSATSLAVLSAQQQQQRSLLVKTTSMHCNLKQTRSAQELSRMNNSLATSTTTDSVSTIERVRPSRHHLSLKLQPVYDLKMNHIGKS
jgi:hypothetical protein